jgi:hypothetical protein
MLQPIFAIKFMLSCSALQGQNERKSVADEEHLKIIRQGVDVWNEWRKKNPELIPDLSGANLAEANLIGLGYKGKRSDKPAEPGHNSS